uniref:Uncharacterized protein n=1 Tax=Myoviridae sp. ctLYp5 TaxID=2827680 RepID=A0A8S5SXN7_9CAUD|nr:MAG TPA: hypothetical protein [Myoviridae sp. ctLYp5]
MRAFSRLQSSYKVSVNPQPPTWAVFLRLIHGGSNQFKLNSL